MTGLGILALIAYLFATLAALVHVFIFLMESVLWARPSTWKRFGIHSQDEADTIKPMALNQGFYNLFLAIGVGVGLILLATPASAGASVVIFFSVACMLAASLVLVISNPKLARAAVTQGALPLIALILLVISYAIA